jgi:hypothetical protein
VEAASPEDERDADGARHAPDASPDDVEPAGPPVGFDGHPLSRKDRLPEAQGMSPAMLGFLGGFGGA